jgi:hypothetical protein
MTPAAEEKRCNAWITYETVECFRRPKRLKRALFREDDLGSPAAQYGRRLANDLACVGQVFWLWFGEYSRFGVFPACGADQ